MSYTCICAPSPISSRCLNAWRQAGRGHILLDLRQSSLYLQVKEWISQTQRESAESNVGVGESFGESSGGPIPGPRHDSAEGGPANRKNIQGSRRNSLSQVESSA